MIFSNILLILIIFMMSQFLRTFLSAARAYHGDIRMQMPDRLVHHRAVVYDGEHMDSPQILRADPKFMVKH